MKYILSLDGGGVKGIIIVKFLEKLEELLRKEKGIKNLCGMFDMYVGTSIGGIICLSLGFNRCRDYKLLYDAKNLRKIMNKSLWDKIMPVQCEPKYDGIQFKESMEYHFGNKRMNETQKHILVTGYNLEKSKPVIYKSRKDTLKVSQVALITGSAPTFFPCIQVEDKTWETDGGVCANNPAMIAYIEAKKIWIDQKYGDEKDEFKILSIGTGIVDYSIDGDDAKDWGALGWLNNNLANVLNNAPNQLIENQCSQLLGKNYLRINGKLEGVSTEIDNATNKNVEKLKLLGEIWFADNVGRIREFFGI